MFSESFCPIPSCWTFLDIAEYGLLTKHWVISCHHKANTCHTMVNVFLKGAYYITLYNNTFSYTAGFFTAAFRSRVYESIRITAWSCECYVTIYFITLQSAPTCLLKMMSRFEMSQVISLPVTSHMTILSLGLVFGLISFPFAGNIVMWRHKLEFRSVHGPRSCI